MDCAEFDRVRAAAKEHERQSQGRGKKGSTTLKNLKPIDATEKIAEATGVGYVTASKAKTIREKAPESVKAKLRTGETSINAAYTQIETAKNVHL